MGLVVRPNASPEHARASRGASVRFRVTARPVEPKPRSGEALLLHTERALSLAREELPYELVVRVEELRRGAGLDDPSLPQDRDVLGDPPSAHDVVGDDYVRAAVLRVDL